MEQRPNVHEGCCHGASYGSELANEGAQEPERELAALVERQCRENLAAEIADLRAWDPELHASAVHLQAEELERASWDCHDLARVDTEAMRVQQIDRDLRVANRPRLALLRAIKNDVVDVHDTADAKSTQVPDCRLQKLGRDSGCWPKGIAMHRYFALSNMKRKNRRLASLIGRCM